MNVRGKRKIGRRFLAVVLSVCMLFAAQPDLWDGVMVQAASGTGWVLDESSGKLTIQSDKGMTEWKSWITKSANKDKKGQVISVEINDGVKTIVSSAFQDCANLNSVTIPNSVNKIAGSAFRGCSNLKNIELPTSITEIAGYAFMSSGLTNIEIPEGVTSIEISTFQSCLALKSIAIPDSVTTIGASAFWKCESLESVEIPAGVTTIQVKAFQDCIALRKVIFYGRGTIPEISKTYNGSAGDNFTNCYFVNHNEKGMYIPCGTRSSYLSKGGWSDYESYIDDRHTGLSYAADGAVIRQSCTACNTVSATATLSLKDGTDLTYTGNEIKPIQVKYSDSWVKEDNNKPDNNAITYENNVNAGTATAGLKIGGATAQINFTIKAATHTVTYNKNGGTITNEKNYTKYTYGTGLTLPTPTRTGYTFVGWYTSSDLSGNKITSISTTASGNKEYWAKWNPISYTISYNIDGGTASGNPASYTIESNAITLTNPTKEGYTFSGWSGTGLDGNMMIVTIPKGSTGNREYTAHWTAAGYKVTLEGKGGNGTTLSAYTHGTKVKLPTDWTKTGHTFAGWYDTESCDGTAVTEIPATATGDKKYWAKWTPNTYVVTFDNHGATGGNLTASQNVTYGSKYGTLPVPSKTGYNFQGWYTSASGGTEVTSETSVTITSAQTLHARWTANKYTITYSGLDGATLTTKPAQHTYGSDTKVGNPIKTGYTFEGWKVNSGSTATKELTLNATAYTANITLTATWTRNSYTINYDLDGGTVTGNPTSYTIESNDITLTNPTKEGYIFAGWSGTGLMGEANQTVKVPKGSSGDREYTAHWAVPSHSHAGISFDSVLTTGGTLNDGNYYLDNDISSSSITIKGTVNLCLNGHRLQSSGADNIVTVGSGATLNLYDCGASGNIAGHRIQSRPGAVVYVTGGTFNMYGGTVKDSWIQSANGGGVYVNSGIVNMYGGTISGNTNQSGKGGGVYVNRGTFNMSGGTISGNSGYGVYIDSGSFTVSGVPKITGNSACNVYLNSGKTITITDALSDTASIGVTTNTSPSDGSPVAITGTNSADYSHCFFSDTTKYEIQNSGSGSSQVVQLVIPHKHSFTYSAGGAVITESCSCGHSETAILSVVSGADLSYTGSAIEACRVTYSDGWKGGTLTLNYSDHINAGTAKAAISKNGETASLDFTINAKSLTDSMVSGLSPAYEWTGNAVMPSVTVKDGSKTLEGDTDYILSYAGNINIGNNTATVTIKGVGNYTGSITKNFTIYKNWNVILHSGGGSGTELTVYEQGTGVTLPTNWTKTGYVFDGWYDNENCSGTAVSSILASDTGNKEYWAKWTDNIAPVIGTLSYDYQPQNLWQWLIGKEILTITVPVTEEGSGADKINYTVTPDGGTAEQKTAGITNGTAEITLSPDFKGAVSIICTDKAGNESAGVTVGADAASNGIILEDHAPEIAFQAENAELLPSGEYKTVPNITVTVADDKNNVISGGIASVSYKIGNGSVKTVDHNYTADMVVNDSFTIPASEISAGETKITVTATDNAENSVTQNYTVKVHTHRGTLVPAVAPTCTMAGNGEYYTCTCGKWFSDSGCTNEITDHTEVVKKALGHDFSGKYQFDTEGHWKKCSRCAAMDSREAHSFEEGSNHCTKCEFEKAGEGHTHTGELHERVEPTCTTKGNIAYYTCNCGKWFSDSSCMEEITDKSKIEIAALEHDFVMKHDQNEHWQQCSRCSLEQSRGLHEYDDDSDTDCNVCGFVRTVQHTHSGTLVPAVEPTCTEDGHEAYYTCSCGKWFSDSGCVNEITDHASVTVEKRGHDFSGGYQSDENGHWKVCARCNVAQAAESHVFDDEYDTDCNQCGYRRNIGNQGNVSKDVEKDEKAPDTVLSDSAEELADIILTEEEKGQIGTGTDIKFILNVKDAGDTVSSGDKTVVQQALDGNTVVKGFSVGQYLDISLFKVIGDTRSAISQTTKKLTIVINVPESLKSKDSTKPRTYAIIRVHDGVAEVLADLDGDTDTVTISTDRFSAYALVYKEAGSGADVTPTPTPGGGDQPTPTPGGSDKPTPTPGGSDEPSPTPGGSDEPSPTPGSGNIPSPTPGGGNTPSPTPDGGIKPSGTPGGKDYVTPAPLPTGKSEKVSEKERRKIEIHSGLKAIQTGKKLQISWGRVTGADGYSVYVQYCRKDFSTKSLNQVKSGKKTKITVKKVNGKKLDTTKNFKLYVVAWKWKNGKKSTLAKTLTIHVAGKDSVKYTNVKSIRLKKTSYTLKKGGTVTLHSKAVLYDKRKKQLSAAHCKEFRYLSSNKKIATITAGGKVKAKGTGECTIYIFAKNGYKRKIKVKVK